MKLYIKVTTFLGSSVDYQDDCFRDLTSIQSVVMVSNRLLSPPMKCWRIEITFGEVLI